MPVTIGSGILDWRGGERRSDRYGSVCLLDENSDSVLIVNGAPLGKRGALTARVTEQRPATHIGDLFRGIFPSPAPVGTVLELGTGTLFSDADEYGPVVGLEPDDGRSVDWLDPHVLYQAHNQRVELLFTPATDGCAS